VRWRKRIEERLAALEAQATTTSWTEVPRNSPLPESLAFPASFVFGGFEGYVEEEEEDVMTATHLPGVYL
jgi:hypothetical protein